MYITLIHSFCVFCTLYPHNHDLTKRISLMPIKSQNNFLLHELNNLFILKISNLSYFLRPNVIAQPIPLSMILSTLDIELHFFKTRCTKLKESLTILAIMGYGPMLAAMTFPSRVGSIPRWRSHTKLYNGGAQGEEHNQAMLGVDDPWYDRLG